MSQYINDASSPGSDEPATFSLCFDHPDEWSFTIATFSSEMKLDRFRAEIIDRCPYFEECLRVERVPHDPEIPRTGAPIWHIAFEIDEEANQIRVTHVERLGFEHVENMIDAPFDIRDVLGEQRLGVDLVMETGWVVAKDETRARMKAIPMIWAALIKERERKAKI
jgi:hypothetical protein